MRNGMKSLLWAVGLSGIVLRTAAALAEAPSAPAPVPAAPTPSVAPSAEATVLPTGAVVPLAPAVVEQEPPKSSVPSWPFGAKNKDGSGPAPTFDPPPPPRDPYAGKGARGAGVAFTVIGGASAVVGIVLLAEAAGRESTCEEDPDNDDCTFAVLPDRIGGAVLASFGGISLLVGIPLWAWGAKVVAENEEPEALATPTVVVGAGSARLDWRF